MYAIKTPHNLNKCCQQIFSSFIFSALLRQSSHHVFALENQDKASSMTDKARARAAIQRHSVNLQMFGPVISDRQKNAVENKKKRLKRADTMQVAPDLNDKEHLADKQVPENFLMFEPVISDTKKHVVKNKRKGPVEPYNMQVVPELNDKEYLADLWDPELNNNNKLINMVKSMYFTDLQSTNEEEYPLTEEYLNANKLSRVVSFLNRNKQCFDSDVLSLPQMTEVELKELDRNVKERSRNGYNMQVVPELNDKEYLADLQVPELNSTDKLIDLIGMVKNIYLTNLPSINEEEFPLPEEYLNVNKLSWVVSFLIRNKQSFDNSVLSLSQIPEDELKELDQIIDRRHIRSRSSDAVRKVRTGTVLKLPLYNMFKNRNKEETNKKLQTKIPLDLCLEKYTVNYILEKTSSESVRKGKRESPFGNTEKKLMEEKLHSYFAPSDFPGHDLPPALGTYWESMKPVLQEMRNVSFNIATTHPVLTYSAQADIICYFKNNLVVMDWTSLFGLSSTSEDIVDAELKTIACVGALHFDPNVNYEKRLCAAVLVSNGSGKPADVLVLKGDEAKTTWTKWLERFQSFYEYKF